MTPKDIDVFIGDPPFPVLLPDWRDIDEVHISISFTWDIEEGKRLLNSWSQYFPEVYIGGPALNDPCDSFVTGRYVKSGVTFTSRGCDNQCPWCLVPNREGKFRYIEGFEEGNIIQDNNLLQAPVHHLDRVFAMLMNQHNIQFSGGLDSRLVNNNIANNLRSLNIGQLFFSADTKDAIKPLRNAISNLDGLVRDKIRCYVLLAFNGESISEATERLELVWEAGALPFAQLYQPPDKYIRYPKEWRDLARKWSRPAITKAMHM